MRSNVGSVAMKINSIMLDGFGLFHEASLENIPDGLVLIAGDNEAGKSTLLGFIRAVLFGFPDGRTNENLYEPLAGGQHGGRITVLTQRQGEVIIERKAGRRGGPVNLLFNRDGSKGGEDELRQLLGGFSKTIYKNIYAFSLGELQTFDSLNADDVRGALYGAGAGTSLMAIPESMKMLEKNVDSLFKPGGSKPSINAKLADLENAQKKLREAVGGINNYEKLVLNRRDIRTGIEKLQQEEDTTQKHHNRTENYLKLWDQWIIFQDAEVKLGNLAYTVSEFPNEGLIRLNNLKNNLEIVTESLEKAEEKKAGLKSQLKDLEVDDLLLSHESAIIELRDDLTRYEDSRKTLMEEQKAVEQKKSDIRRELANLGSDWTEERVYDLDRSLFTQNAIRQYQSRHQEAKSEKEKSEDALSQANEEHESARREEEAAKKELRKYQDLKPLPDANILSAIQSGKDQFSSVARDLPKREKELKDASSALEQAIKEIDPDWTASRAESFDCSVPAQERIQRFEQELADTENRIDTRKKRLELEESNRINIQRELKTVEEKYREMPEASLSTREEFVSRKNDFRSLRNNLNKKELLSESISNREERLAHIQSTLKKSLSRKPDSLIEYLKWLSIALILIGLLTMGILSVLPDRLLLGGILGGVFSIPGICLFVFRRFTADQLSGKRLFDQSVEEEKKAIEKLEEKLKNLKHEFAQVESRFEKLISVLGISADTGLTDIDRLENEIELELDHFSDKSRLEEELNRIREGVNTTGETVENLTGGIKSLEETYRQIENSWERQLDHLSLKPGIKPRTVNLIFTKVDGIKTRIGNIKNLEERIKEMLSARDEYSALLDRVPELTGKIPEDLNELPDLVDRFLEQTRSTEKRRQDRDLVAQTSEEKQKNRKALKDKMNRTEQRLAKAIELQNREIDAWQKWLSNNALDREVTPETALDALGTVNRCIQFIDAKSELDKSIELKEDFIKKYIDLHAKLFAKLDRMKSGRPDYDRLGTEIELLSQALENNKNDLIKKNGLQDQLSSISREIDTMKPKIDFRKEEIKKLTQEGGAEDEEIFRNRGELFKKRQELLSELDSSGKNMKVISGESNLETLKDILIEYTKEELGSESRMLQQKLREIKDALEAARQQLAETKNNLDILSSSDDISRLRSEEEKCKEEIRSAAKVWGTHSIARYLLNLARERFEKEHQPKVIREASNFFRTFTGGEYQNIIAPLGEQNIEAMTGRGKQKNPQQLSRATVEQLFLALRFGYMVNYAENSEVLPVIMDDILVNFDPARSNNTSTAILELAKSHQVLFFTCHPETISIFKKQQADVPVYRIENGEFGLADKGAGS